MVLIVNIGKIGGYTAILSFSIINNVISSYADYPLMGQKPFKSKALMGCIWSIWRYSGI